MLGIRRMIADPLTQCIAVEIQVPSGLGQATPRSVTNRTASSLYSRLNRRLVRILTSGLNKNT